MGHVMDSPGRVWDRSDQLVSAQPRDTNGHVGGENRRALELADLPGRVRPVERVVVDVVVNRDVRTKLVAQVQVVRI